MGNQLRQLLRREQVEEEAVRRNLSEQVAEVKPDIRKIIGSSNCIRFSCC